MGHYDDARKVFALFGGVLDQRHGSTRWSLRLEDDDLRRLGLPCAQTRGVLDQLARHGLLQRDDNGSYRVTDLGAALWKNAVLDVLMPP